MSEMTSTSEPRAQLGGRQPLKLLEKNEEKYGGEGICSVLITVAATKILAELDPRDPKFDATVKRLRESGLPWQIWEGETKVWESSPFEHLQLDEMGVATGEARVPVGDLLQAVLDTHPEWSIQALMEAARPKLDDAKKAAADAEHDADEAWKVAKAAVTDVEKAASTAARMSVAAAASAATAARAAEAAAKAAKEGKRAEAEAAINERDRARVTADAARKDSTLAAAGARVAVARATAATAAAVRATATAHALRSAADNLGNGGKQALRQPGAGDADEIYENLTLWVNVNGTEPDEKWIVLPIDMCMHGC